MMFPSLRSHGPIAIDVETCDVDLKTRGSGEHRGAFVAGIAIATAHYKEYYPIAHQTGVNLDREKVISWLNRELSADVPKIGARLLYDVGFLTEAGVRISGPLYDIQIAEPLLNENRFSYSLENLAQDYLKTGKQEDTLIPWLIEKFGKKNPKSNIWRAPPDIVAPYAIADVDLPLRIFQKQQLSLQKQNLWDLFVMESKLIPLLVAMHRRGVRVDLDGAEVMLKQMRAEQGRVLKKIKNIAGFWIEPWNAKSIGKLFDKLKLEYPLTPKTEAPSFTREFLEHHEHPVAGMIRRARWLDKMCSAFLTGAILEGHTNGRVHCTFNQLKSDQGGTVTGRFSSSKPNLTQIPIRTDEGKALRKMFLPDENQLMWKKDWSQIEYRLIAHDACHLGLRGGRQVVDEFNNNPKADFHQIVADMVGCDRSSAKTINFGLAYGEGVKKLCKDLGLAIEDGTKIINEYHQRAPFMRPLAQGLTNQAKITGIVKTLLNRRRRFDLWIKNNPLDPDNPIIMRHPFPGSQRAFTHKALNARTQGSAADILKKSMVEIWESGICDIVGVPQLCVHDELVGSFADNKKSKEALKEIHYIMENTVKLSLPLKVDSGSGPDWGSCK